MLLFRVSFQQSTPVGTTVYSSIKATDIDAGVNGAVEYFLIEGSHNLTDDDLDNSSSSSSRVAADGFGTFAIAYPHQGHVSFE